MVDLRKVAINSSSIDAISDAIERFVVDLDSELILDKNKAYGNAWQAEGPFLASSRMKDKITRVETTIKEARKSASLVTAEEGFQDILEMISYGKLLMLYWVWNELGLSGSEVDPVTDLYNWLIDEMQAQPDSYTVLE